ncbi:MAG: GxxExxY protein [Planctomycetales bacterium]
MKNVERRTWIVSGFARLISPHPPRPRPLKAPHMTENSPAVKLDELTSAIIGAAIKVHRSLGPGLLESAYRACLKYELEKFRLLVQEEHPVPVVYEGIRLDCGFRADLLVESRVVVECKAKQKLHPVDEAQLISHLRLLDLRVGLLLNFHELVLKTVSSGSSTIIVRNDPNRGVRRGRRGPEARPPHYEDFELSSLAKIFDRGFH